LVELLSVEGCLSITAKARFVAYQSPRVYHSARIFTDARPIFSRDAAGPPSAFIVTHTLKIDTHENAKDHEWFATLDSRDLKALKAVVDRALEKEESLRQSLSKTEVPILGSEVQVLSAIHEYESQYRKRRPKKTERDCDAPLPYLLTWDDDERDLPPRGWLETAVRGAADHGRESSQLERAIEASKELLLLPENWDEEGALQISESTWGTAIDFLRRTHASVQTRLGKDLLIPTIGPCTERYRLHKL
jgi:hypothetical protein